MQLAFPAVHDSVQPLLEQQSVPGLQPPGHLQLAPQVHLATKVQHDCFFDSIYDQGFWVRITDSDKKYSQEDLPFDLSYSRK